MARQNSYLDHLSQVSLFSACSKKELAAVAKASDEITIEAGRILCEQGSIGREAFVIVEGTAEVRRNDRKIADLGPGACVGELSLIDHGPRSATVKALTDMTVLVLGPREFSALLDDAPSITHKLMKALAGRIRDLDAKAFG
jgi:CRP/FNR family transcriptional regulator, cyclic AMP receptor protein